MRYPIEFYRNLKIGQEIYFIENDRIFKGKIRIKRISEIAPWGNDYGKTDIKPQFDCIFYKIELHIYGSNTTLDEHDFVCVDIEKIKREITEDFEKRYRDETAIS